MNALEKSNDFTPLCPWCHVHTVYKYPVKRPDDTYIFLYSCAKCDCWFECTIEEMLPFNVAERLVNAHYA